jgi:hypothetical protein
MNFLIVFIPVKIRGQIAELLGLVCGHHCESWAYCLLLAKTGVSSVCSNPLTHCDLQKKKAIFNGFQRLFVPGYTWNSADAIPIYFSSHSTFIP